MSTREIVKLAKRMAPKSWRLRYSDRPRFGTCRLYWDTPRGSAQLECHYGINSSVREARAQLRAGICTDIERFRRIARERARLLQIDPDGSLRRAARADMERVFAQIVAATRSMAEARGKAA